MQASIQNRSANIFSKFNFQEIVFATSKLFENLVHVINHDDIGFEHYAKIGFEPMQLRAGGVSSNAGSAAGAVSTGSLYAAQAGSSPDFGKLTEAQMAAKSEQNIAQTIADAQLEGTQIGADASVKIAKMQSRNLEKQAGRASSAGTMSALGSVAAAAFMSCLNGQ